MLYLVSMTLGLFIVVCVVGKVTVFVLNQIVYMELWNPVCVAVLLLYGIYVMVNILTEIYCAASGTIQLRFRIT